MKIESLSYLLKAPSKKIVEQIFLEIFKNFFGTINKILINSLINLLNINENQSYELINCIRELEKIAIYENTNNLDGLFPSDFHKDLKKLVLQIIGAHLQEWRNKCISEQVSLPKLKEIDWRIDVKRSFENNMNLSIPSLLVQLTIQEEVNKNKIYEFELDKQSLEIMVDSFLKIKDQLASLNK